MVGFFPQPKAEVSEAQPHGMCQQVLSFQFPAEKDSKYLSSPDFKFLFQSSLSLASRLAPCPSAPFI